MGSMWMDCREAKLRSQAVNVPNRDGRDFSRAGGDAEIGSICVASTVADGDDPPVIEFLEQIRRVSPHAEPILVISLTAILGLLIGSVKVRGIKLGVAGMLFSGLLLGHMGLTLDPHLMSFLKEFGLALFVFTVGLQLGPGFFNSLKKDGLKLNGLALTIVLSGALLVFSATTCSAGTRVCSPGFSPDPPPTRRRLARPSRPWATSRTSRPRRRWPMRWPIPLECSASSS
jgi:hypothetical protein